MQLFKSVLFKSWNLRFYFIGILLAILCWYLITISPNSNLHKFSPEATFYNFTKIIQSQKVWVGMAETLKRLIGGLFIASVIGIPIGLATGFSKLTDKIFYVPFQFIRMISPLSWTPVAIILFGVGSEPVYFLIAIAAVWPIIINTRAGVLSTDKSWIEVAQCLGANNRAIVRHILFRAALPNIIIGIQLALGVAWIVLVPAEMLGVASGLGYMILDYRDIQSYGSIMSIILIIGVLGVLTDLPLRFLLKRFSYD